MCWVRAQVRAEVLSETVKGCLSGSRVPVMLALETHIPDGRQKQISILVIRE